MSDYKLIQVCDLKVGNKILFPVPGGISYVNRSVTTIKYVDNDFVEIALDNNNRHRLLCSDYVFVDDSSYNNEISFKIDIVNLNIYNPSPNGRIYRQDFFNDMLPKLHEMIKKNTLLVSNGKPTDDGTIILDKIVGIVTSVIYNGSISFEYKALTGFEEFNKNLYKATGHTNYRFAMTLVDGEMTEQGMLIKKANPICIYID